MALSRRPDGGEHPHGPVGRARARHGGTAARLLAVGVLAGLLAACGGTSSGSGTSGGGPASSGGGPSSTRPTPTTTVPSTTAPPTQATTVLRVYFMRQDHLGVGHRRVAVTLTPAKVALTALLAGPTALERSAGLSTTVPAGTRLLGVSISAGTATVDLSSEFASGGGSLSTQARLAQVAFTVTQFPTVSRVTFELAGTPVTVFGSEGLVLDHPVTRSTFEDLLPPIFPEAPAPGDTVSSPVRVTGSANVFEAQFRVEIRDGAGRVLADQGVMATSGTGTRGTFDATVAYHLATTGPGTVTFYDLSAKDGSRQDVVDIPVTLTAA